MNTVGFGSKALFSEFNFWYILSNYESLQEAIAVIGGEDATLYIPRGKWNGDGVVIPSNIHFIFDKGAMLTGDIEIYASFEARPYRQIFDGNITGAPQVEKFYAEWFGAKGDGIRRDDVEINKALELAGKVGGEVVLRPGKTYLVRATGDIVGGSVQALYSKGVRPPSNSTLTMYGAALKAIPNDENYSAIININNAENVIVRGGTIIGDRYDHLVQTGDNGFGIFVYRNSKKIIVEDVVAQDCFGDGFFISFTQECQIRNCTSTRSRRNGMAVIKANKLRVSNFITEQTHGVAPQVGIDVEPNFADEDLVDIVFENIISRDNASYGFELYVDKQTPKHINITVNNITLERNGRNIGLVGEPSNTVGRALDDGGRRNILFNGVTINNDNTRLTENAVSATSPNIQEYPTPALVNYSITNVIKIP